MNSFFPKQATRRFDGKVIFLSGNESFSSSVLMLTIIKDNQICKIIGEKPSMKPTSFGDILLFELPNTKFKGSISTSYFERPDFSKNNEDVLYPDIEINTTFEEFLNGKDPCWDTIINSTKN